MWAYPPIPFSLAVTEVQDVGDVARLGRVGMLGAFGVEAGGRPFDDARIAAVAAWREAEARDLVEQVGQEAVEKKGVAWEEAMARW